MLCLSNEVIFASFFFVSKKDHRLDDSMPLKYVANAEVYKVSVKNGRVLNESFGVFL